MLPVVYFRTRRYFVDLRLRQFREMENPHHSVEFDSNEGRQICRQSGVITCRACRMSVIVPTAGQDEELRCMNCFARILR
jgi:hypothetical protein